MTLWHFLERTDTELTPHLLYYFCHFLLIHAKKVSFGFSLGNELYIFAKKTYNECTVKDTATFMHTFKG